MRSFQWHDSLPSTQDYLINNPTNNIIIAREQKKGRGRGNSKWFNLKDSLHFSYSHNVNILDDINYLKILSTLKLTLRDFKVETALKWPNDILIKNFYKKYKVCGILIDKFPDRVVVGIGINLGYSGGFEDLGFNENNLNNLNNLENENGKLNENNLNNENILNNNNILSKENYENNFKNIRELTGKNILPNLFLKKYFENLNKNILFDYDLPDFVNFENENLKVLDKKKFILENGIKVDEIFYKFDGSEVIRRELNFK